MSLDDGPLTGPELEQAVRAAVAGQRSPEPAVRRRLAALTDPAAARKLGRLLAGLTPSDDELRPVRVAVLATCTVGPLEYLARTALVGAGLLPQLTQADYGSFEITLATGDLGEQDLLLLLMDESYFLPEDYSGADADQLADYIADRSGQLRALLIGLLARSSATVVLHTVPMPAALRAGFISWQARAVLAESWFRLNADLLALAREQRGLVVTDLVSALADLPFGVRDARLHSYADLPYTDAVLQLLAGQFARVAQARAGLSRKVLALDLDNTLWGGVLGEVGAAGVELGGLYPGKAYLNLQRTVRRLREQGVILVLASKNDPEAVQQALADHPEMLLRSEAFSVTAVNWSDKAGNLRQAADTLGLSIDSFVFMDDSSFERGQVSAELPGVAVLAADGDPAQLASTLLSGGWFDVLELTDTDRQRPALYRTKALRNDFEGGFGSTQDYLQALQITLTVEPVTDFTVGRAVQLAARTNQFNLTGIRFDEQATEAIRSDPEQQVLLLSVADRFGDEGIVGALWVDGRQPAWQVLNFVLSCRVLSRGIELAALAWLADEAAGAGAVALNGSYQRTAKNAVSADVWQRAGYAAGPSDGSFTLDLTGDRPASPAWITISDRKRALT
ncbi:MAG TPA: HAD-IIIC family phosphatase [Jatrophihabitans sp.]|nr:HAD-IIIC family phosphatase [Jatrophihabitans sp.]